MVAQITDGTAFDKHGRPFRRRRFLPGLLMFTAMAAAALLVWVVALSRPPEVQEAAVCNPPPPSESGEPLPDLGDQVSRDTMLDVTPAKLSDTTIRVLNASGQGGQAAEVAGTLRDIGFDEPEAANDAIYSTTRLQCQGQIRFGPSGRAAAAALWLVAPCAELFQDQRTDDTVDLALGTDFTEITHSDDIDAVLASLMPEATQPADASLLKKAHTGTC